MSKSDNLSWIGGWENLEIFNFQFFKRNYTIFNDIIPSYNVFSNLSVTSNDLVFQDQIRLLTANHTQESVNTLTKSSMTGILFAVTVMLLLITKYFIRNDKTFGSLPGPRGIWLLGISYRSWSPKERMNLLAYWAITYKPCFAFALGTHKFVFLTSASAVQKLLQSSDSGHLNKGFGYEAFVPFVKHGLVMSNVEKWKERRKFLSRAFTHRSLIGYMHVFNKQSRSLVDCLEKLFESPEMELRSIKRLGKPIDEILGTHTLRVICEATMGTDISEIEDFHKVPSSLATSKELCMMRIVQPWLMNDWLWKWHPKSAHLKHTATMFDRFIWKVIGQQKEKMSTVVESEEETENDPKKHTPGIKKAFKSMIEEMISAGIDDEGVVEEVGTFIVAGYESTSLTLQYLLLCLALNPKHQEICREEVDRVFEQVSFCPSGDLQHVALNDLKHLERCISETMRLFPAISLYTRKLESSLKIDENIELQPGVNVCIYTPGLHWDPNYFPNPTKFDPDRFLPENVIDRGQHAFLPFSTGPRNCIGYKFALNEIKVFAARLLRHFKIETTETFDSVPLHLEITLTPQRPYNFILTKRLQ